MFFTHNALRWLETLLWERFGHRFVLVEQLQTLELFLPGSQGSIVFDQLQPVFHQSRSNFPCKYWQASVEGYKAPIEDEIQAPSECKLPAPLIDWHEHLAIVHYDILGLTYWMITRLEEVGRTDLDVHKRFPATSSHAFKYEYLERPVVDEWLVILGQVVERVWPGIKLKQHEFSIKVSHDVDSPSQYAFKTWSTIARMMASHLIKSGDLKAFIYAPYIKLVTSKKLHRVDPFNTFDWLMDVSEANNVKSAFYFICGRTNPGLDADYELENQSIRSLLRHIHDRGHEIGLHPSYGTYQTPGLIKQEIDRLKRVCAEEGIEQPKWGGRMHYLRWEQPTTMCAWADAGMSYDSTLGYADRPGFRCGTCHEYPAFDPVSQEQLHLRVRPLVVMECSVMDSMYLGLGPTTSAETHMVMLKEYCRKVDGMFVLLWHNSYFKSPQLDVIYQNLMRN